MRALFVTGSLAHGGAERHSIALANRLAERGHECHAAYLKEDAGQLERVQRPVGVHCLHARRYLDRRALGELGALIARLRPSVVVAANPYALLYAALGLRRAGFAAPLVATFHTTLLRSAKEWLQMLYYRPFLWRADRLVFVCEAQRSYWRRRLIGTRSSLVIHNGVDLEHWQPAGAEAVSRSRRRLGYAPEDYVIGLCGVLRPEKNHVQLVDAVAALRAQGLPARALLIGDGPTRPAVEARARAAGVAGAVHITGFQQDVRPYVSACDAAVICSTAVETFSLAALEAMALGRAVVHSDIGGAREMVRNAETGYLFRAGDTPALVQRLAALAEPAARGRMGAAARAEVAARFSERAMVDKYEAVLTNLETKWRKREDLRRSAPAH